MTCLARTLSPTQSALVSTVARFRQATSSQLRRLHYQGTPYGCQVRSRRHLARLVDLGQLARLGPYGGGYGGGTAESVYQLPTTKARTPDQHTLTITELYVRLVEQGADILAYDPEPWSYLPVGSTELKPDAFVDLATAGGRYQYFVEVDRGSEYRAQIMAKMRRYTQAIDSQAWPEDKTFPQVIWTVPDTDRARYVRDTIARTSIPELFDVVVFDRAVERMTGH